MDKINSIEYGVANNLQYKLTISLTNTDTGLPVQLTDLFVTLYIKSDLSEDALFSITGIYNEDDEAFDFSFTQSQSDLMTVGKWYYGFEVRLQNINGKIIHRNTFYRQHLQTGAKI